ncbi:MAG: hypothetical protein AB7P21_23010 [Lautropia sp.]
MYARGMTVLEIRVFLAEQDPTAYPGLDRDDSAGGHVRHEPQHARAAAKLMSRIATAAYPVGSLLPTEHGLSEASGRSRQTIRVASTVSSTT